MDPTNPINSFNLRANPTRPGIGSWQSDATWTRNKFQSVLSSRILSGTQPNLILSPESPTQLSPKIWFGRTNLSTY